MSAVPIVEVRNLGKKFAIQRPWRTALRHPGAFDLRIVLEGVCFAVAKGECFGVLGQNGAGKTTLFKILATLVLPDAGSARVAGIDVTSDPDGVRQVLTPVIPTERSLYWRISAEENLRLYASLYGLAGAVGRRRIRDVLEIVGLDGVDRKQVGLFSSGMKQRLLIARALLGRPSVLLLDEPTRSLDPVSARDFRTFLRKQIREVQNTTILLASHDHEEVTELTDRVAVLDQGRLLAIGPTESLLSASRAKICSIWTPDARHPALEGCVTAAGGRIVAVEPVTLQDGEGWHRVRIEIATDEAGTADILKELTLAGVRASRFTRDDFDLAALLERVRGDQGPVPVEQQV